jgi:hypothetical protein
MDAAFRGGNWNDGTRAGVFSLNLDNAPSNWNPNVGFRCVLPAEGFHRISSGDP